MKRNTTIALLAGAAALMGFAVLATYAKPAHAQATPTFNSASTVTGAQVATDELHRACVFVQPKDGAYGWVDSDAPLGVTRACVQVVTLLESAYGAAKITSTTSTLAGASTTIAAADANRRGIAIQCAAACKVSETGATLTSASYVNGEGGVVIAAGGYFVPQGAAVGAYTAYSTGAVTVTQYLK